MDNYKIFGINICINLILIFVNLFRRSKIPMKIMKIIINKLGHGLMIKTIKRNKINSNWFMNCPHYARKISFMALKKIVYEAAPF